METAEKSAVGNCFQYFKEEINGKPILVQLEIPNKIMDVEAVGKLAAEKCNIGPLASYLFGFCQNDPSTESNSYYHLDPCEHYPMDLAVVAEYRLCVYPNSVERLTEFSSNALRQLFLATKYDLMQKRLKICSIDEQNLEQIVNRLMYHDLCRMIVKQLPANHVSATNIKEYLTKIFDVDHLHMTFMEQYRKLRNDNSVKSSKFIDIISRQFAPCTDKHLLEALRSHVIDTADKLYKRDEIDFMMAYIREVSASCPQFQKNRYYPVSFEKKEEFVEEFKCSSLTVSCEGITITRGRNRHQDLWAQHFSITNFANMDEKGENVKISLSAEGQNDLIITFQNKKDKSSFVADVLCYHRIFRSFSSPLKSDFPLLPSQKIQSKNKYWGPLCEDSNDRDGKESILQGLQCATTMLCELAENAGFNAIGFESSQFHNEVIVFVRLNENESELHRIKKSTDGSFYRSQPDIASASSIIDLFPAKPIKLFFLAEATLPPFRMLNGQKQKRKIRKTDGVIEGQFNVGVRGRFEDDGTHVVVKYVKSKYSANIQAMENFRQAEEFLSKCNNGSKSVRFMYERNHELTTYGSYGLVLEYFSLTLKQYLNMNRSKLSIKSLLEPCRSVTKALEFLKQSNIIHGQVCCKNLLVDTNRSPIRVVLKEPNGTNEPPWTSTINSGPSFAGDNFALGTTIWEIFNLGDQPTNNDPYFLPVPKGCLTSFYEMDRFLRETHYDPKCIHSIGFNIQMLLNDCWSFDPSSLKTIRSTLDNADLGEVTWTVNLDLLESSNRVHATSSIVVDFEERIVLKENGQMLKVKMCSGARLLGQGHFGEVYKVHNSENENEFFALKQIVADSTERPSLLKEIATMTKCDHKNILKCIGHTFGRDDNRIIGAVMPFMRNGSLESYMRINRSNVSIKQRITFCKEIAEGMQYLHNVKSLIHFDLAARNVLLDHDLTVKICDFGLSKRHFVISEEVTTLPPQCAPEWYKVLLTAVLNPTDAHSQRSLHEILDPRGDIYAYGVTVWEMETIRAMDIGDSRIVCVKSGKRKRFSLNLTNDEYSFFQCLIENCIKEKLEERASWNGIISYCDKKLVP